MEYKLPYLHDCMRRLAYSLQPDLQPIYQKNKIFEQLPLKHWMDVFPIAMMNTPIYAVHTSEEQLSANPSCQ
jgi:hypothetical protein